MAAEPAVAASTADNCDWRVVRNADDGYGIMSGTHNLKVAPYQSCGNVGPVFGGEKIYFWCWEVNSYGNYWVYGRVAGTSIYGWMSIANFSSYTTAKWPRC
ncbi:MULTISPECIES: hypothetical protein [unclassified Streptomyces]|uniref:hypothetical protein n=1 Tax=unclassified Streptomyces TaxID=2593676 RepID=UPI003435B39D